MHKKHNQLKKLLVLIQNRKKFSRICELWTPKLYYVPIRHSILWATKH